MFDNDSIYSKIGTTNDELKELIADVVLKKLPPGYSHRIARNICPYVAHDLLDAFGGEEITDVDLCESVARVMLNLTNEIEVR